MKLGFGLPHTQVLQIQKLGAIIKVKKRTAFTSFYTTMLIGYARVPTHDQNLDFGGYLLFNAKPMPLIIEKEEQPNLM